MAPGSDRGLRAEIVRAGALLAARGLVVAGEGNLSQRLDGTRFLITPAGADKGRLASADAVVVDGDGATSAARPPSSEWRLHRECYRLRADVRAVCHAHPPAATAFACARRPPPCALLAEALAELGREVPVAAYADPGGPELAANVRGPLREGDAVLLANHGAVTVGADLAAAVRRMMVLERLCRVALDAARLGGGELLPPDVVRRLTG